MSPNCGLDHVSNSSELGDGTVLASDVLLPNYSPGANQRWGEKYIFNIAEYNRKNAKNYSHASIISASPVVSTLVQIMLNNIGEYVLPAYITRHGGIRMGGSGGSQTSSGQTEHGGVIVSTSTSSIALADIIKNKKYEISASDAVLISAKDPLGNVGLMAN
jgi:hypothetical protein